MSYLGKVVAVEWLDAWCDQNETKASDWKASCPVTTHGVCVRDTDDLISVAADLMPDDELHRGVTHVPKAMVRKVRVLK